MKLNLMHLGDVDELATPAVDSRTTLDSPALAVFTDFTRHTPLLIDSRVNAAEAEALMLKTHVKLKFVVDENYHFLGIVSYDDLNSQAIMQRLIIEEKQRDELMITDFMQPRDRLFAFDYEQIKKAKIKDVVTALQHHGQQHCLVVDFKQHLIRGIFSSSDIARKLNLAIDIRKESSFLRIFEVVNAA